MLNDSCDSEIDGHIQVGSGRAAGAFVVSSADIAFEGHEAEVLAALSAAVICPDRSDGEQRLRAILESGVDKTRLIDVYIPAAARRFGAEWSNSGRSFAEVTIAVARLQGWLRELEPQRREGRPFRLDAPEVLLVVVEGAHHTLGAMVAMSRFRRLGALVRLSLGQDARTIGQVARLHHTDLVAISAAGNENLDFLSSVINSVRSGVGPAPLIVLGGEILNQCPDAPAMIGADFGSSDPEEALSLCGHTTSADAASPAPTERHSLRGDPRRAPQDV